MRNEFELEGVTYVIVPKSEWEMVTEDALVGRPEIAQMVGISRNRLSEKPWLLPDFGRGLKRKRNVRWPRHVVEKWLAQDHAELRRQWFELSKEG